MKQELAFEFAEWLGYNYIRLHGVWVHKFVSQMDKENWKTTDELFKSFEDLKSKNLLNTEN